MKKTLIVAGFLGTSLLGSGRAQAGWLHDAVCDALKATPAYWAIYGAVEGLKATGGLNSEMECLDLGDSVGDFGIPDGTYKDCVCEAVGWPAAQPGVCSDPHNACTAGVALGGSTAMMSCQASPTENVASKVCLSDSFCCDTEWDSICVSEAGTAFWSSMDSREEAIVMRTDLTCDQKDQLISTLQQEANATSSQLSCLGSKTYQPQCSNHFVFEHTFNGECIGVAAGNLNNGTNIISWPCNAQPPSYTGATDQAWSTDLNDCVMYNGSQYCSVRNQLNYNKCLGVSGGNTNSGTHLILWDCLGQSHPDQYWSINLQGDGQYYFTDLASAKTGKFYGIHYNGTKSTFTLGAASPSSEVAVSP